MSADRTNLASRHHGLVDIITDPLQMQQKMLSLRRSGRRIAFVPTMGYLHDGHLSLLQEGRQRGDILVLSIFVNPTQFGPKEDLSTYPRDLDRDCHVARQAGVDVIFFPDAATMYAHDASTWVDVEGLSATLCGASRPGHFRGVATVVTKLFNIVQPDVALFGSKDFQQLAVIRRMVRDLHLPVEIVGMPIVREADGLAMSSRNVYLSPLERRQALSLSRALRSCAEAAAGGEMSAQRLVEHAKALITAEADASIDYVEICHRDTLEPLTAVNGDAVMLLAVRIGRTRLIDNAFLPGKPA